MVIKNVRKYAKKEKKEFAKKLRRNQTRCEKLVWQKLHAKQLGVRFTRQRVLFGWIVDFYCGKIALAIEIDGGTHIESQDNYRDRQLEKRGIVTMRFTNKQAYDELDWIIRGIRLMIKSIGSK